MTANNDDTRKTANYGESATIKTAQTNSDYTDLELEAYKEGWADGYDAMRKNNKKLEKENKQLRKFLEEFNALDVAKENQQLKEKIHNQKEEIKNRLKVNKQLVEDLHLNRTMLEAKHLYIKQLQKLLSQSLCYVCAVRNDIHNRFTGATPEQTEMLINQIEGSLK